MLHPPSRPVSPAHRRILSLTNYAFQTRQNRNRIDFPNQLDSPIILSDSSSVVEQAYGAFSGFPKLPPEIRIKIWQMALPPRVITITPTFNRDTWAHEVEVAAERVGLFGVCQESRAEALRTFSQVNFNNTKNAFTFIDWSQDTIFLDLPDESMNIDNTVSLLGTMFQSVQVLAIRMRSHVFWGFPDFLRGASHLQKLIFVDEPERTANNINGFLYLMDLGSLGFVRGCYLDPYKEYQYFQEEVWVKLVECSQNKQFDIRQWEMGFELISWVRNLNAKGERYCLLLPVT